MKRLLSLRCIITMMSAAVCTNGQTLSELADQAVRNNRDLQGLRQRMPEAEGARLQAGLRPNPTLDLNISNGAIVRNSGYWDGAVGYSQVIELGGKRQRRIDLAEADLKAIPFEIQERERGLRAAVHAAYIEGLAAERNQEIARELLTLTERSLTVVKARVAQGESPRLDESLLTVEVNRIQADLVVFGGQRDRALATLRTLAGMSPGEPITLAAKLDLPPEGAALDETRQRAVAERPDVQFLRRAEISTGAAVRLEQSNAIPNLTATAKFGYTYDFIQRLQLTPVFSLPVTDSCPIVTVGISIDLPWRNKNQGNIQAAVARREGVRLRREYQEQVVANEVTNALSRLQTARQAVRVFQRSVLEQAQENLRIVRGVYEQGELKLLDVLNEQRRLIDSQRTFTDLLKESQLAWAEVQRVTGNSVRGEKP
ncbi:MAG: TolC family protein [Acidobacteriota bacterium]